MASINGIKYDKKIGNRYFKDGVELLTEAALEAAVEEIAEPIAVVPAPKPKTQVKRIKTQTDKTSSKV